MDKKIYWPPKVEGEEAKDVVTGKDAAKAFAWLTLIFLGAWALFLGAAASLIYAARWAWEAGAR